MLSAATAILFFVTTSASIVKSPKTSLVDRVTPLPESNQTYKRQSPESHYEFVQLNGPFKIPMNEAVDNFTAAWSFCRKWKAFLPYVDSDEDVEKIKVAHLVDTLNEGGDILLGAQYSNAVNWYNYYGDGSYSANAYLNSFPMIEKPHCLRCGLTLHFKKWNYSLPINTRSWEFRAIDFNTVTDVLRFTKAMYCAIQVKRTANVYAPEPGNISHDLKILRDQIQWLRSDLDNGFANAKRQRFSLGDIIWISIWTTVVILMIIATIAIGYHFGKKIR